MELNPNNRAEFVQKLESDILPILRKQKGFKDEVTFVSTEPSNKIAFAVSFWDSKESAEAYSKTSYTEVGKILSKLTQGSPRVKSFEVASSTFHNIGTTKKAA
jgi:heme-degrading monooxygenase HmoA